MFLRHSTVRKNGKTHTYWRLVRSVRTGGKVRQQTVACLGELDAEGRVKASALARHFLGPKLHQLSLFDKDPDSLPVTPVRLTKVETERGRAFGDVWLGWTVWRALGLDDFCRSVMPVGREAVPWADMATILVLARLCEPSSELHIAEDWYRRTALEDLLGVDPEIVHHTRLYQALDRLLPHKEALEEHLKKRFGELFDLEYDLLLYDVTSTYFEGESLLNPLARRGYSRDGKPQCKQVCIGLVVTREGFPLGYEIFAGNTTDVTTVQQVVETMEKRYGKASRIWVMDRGMVSEENLEWLRQENRAYLVGTPRSELKKWQAELVDKAGWNSVREGLEVKLCSGPDGTETFILCRSADRREKEAAMHQRFTDRIRKALESLSTRLEHLKKPAERGQIERQIGRILERNSRGAGRFAITVHEDPNRKSGLRLEWRENSAWSEWAELTEGAYILRTNVTGWTAENLWKTYIQLWQAEAAFRIHKSELEVRPVWHQKENRVRAHILVCYLAFALWKTLEGWMSRAGLGSSPKTVMEELARIQSVDVLLHRLDGKPMRIRCVVRPDKAQATLLSRLGLDLPKRLRMPPSMQPCSANSD